jgi:hypothetical protein
MPNSPDPLEELERLVYEWRHEPPVAIRSEMFKSAIVALAESNWERAPHQSFVDLLRDRGWPIKAQRILERLRVNPEAKPSEVIKARSDREELRRLLDEARTVALQAGDAEFAGKPANPPSTESIEAIPGEREKILKRHKLASHIMAILERQAPLTEPQIKDALETQLSCTVSESTLGKLIMAMRKTKPPMIRNQRKGKNRGYSLAT